MVNPGILGSAKALVGHTGFVGSALRRQADFADCFNSANISDIAGRRFDTVVCAAAPGSMFEANRAPERDREKIGALIGQLQRVDADRFVLISSIAVLEDFAGGYDEGTQRFQTQLPYGRHRRELEAFVEDRFDNHLIVRLPALFGEGLRKNFLFDLMNPVPTMLPSARVDALAEALDPSLSDQIRTLYSHDTATGMMKLHRAALDTGPHRAALDEAVTALGYSATGFHHPETTYQYYGIDRLWRDIAIAAEAGLSHIHLVAEPVKAATIHERLTGRAMPDAGAKLHREDMRTRHAGLWDRSGPYLADGGDVLERLADFHTRQRQPA